MSDTLIRRGRTPAEPRGRQAAAFRTGTKHRSPFWIVVSVLLWVLGLAFLAPFAWAVLSSLKAESEIFRLPVSILPQHPTLANYTAVWDGDFSMERYFLNSIIVAVARVAGELVTSALAGYAFARLRFRGRNAIFIVYIGTLVIPFQILLIPRFLLFREMGLYDTLWALIIPGAFTVFGTFLLRQFFAGLPEELSEAARIDGAGEFQIFLRIMLPLVKPALAGLAILSFVWSWNDYETPLVMLTTSSHYTVPLGLSQFIDVSGSFSAGPILAGSVSSLIPVFIVFFGLQRHFVQAITRTGIRG